MLTQAEPPDPLAQFLDFYRNRDRDYASDPVSWVHERLKDRTWSKQREILEALVDNDNVAVPACHNVGKSWIASRIAAWWIDVHPVGDAFVVTTAPTHRQVRNILWRELFKAHRSAGLPGELNQTEWWIDGEIVAFGAKPADQDPDAFQGIHANHVLVVIDEASAVPRALWTAADTLASNDGSKIFAIGNPDSSRTYFYEICQPGSGWHVINIDAFETPNFTHERVGSAMVSKMLSRNWVEEKRRQWGEDSPLWASKVRGRFPTEDTDGVVPWGMVQSCRAEDLGLYDPDHVELGIDVGAGGDETVVYERAGMKATRCWKLNETQSERLTNKLVKIINESGATRVKVDVIGIGWGVVGHLRAAGSEGHHKATILPVNVGKKPNSKRFVKLRDEIWWMARELSEEGAWDLSAVGDETLTQLLAPSWEVAAGGRIKVESKDVTRLRLGRSPDEADALLLAFYAPPQRRKRASISSVTKG